MAVVDCIVSMGSVAVVDCIVSGAVADGNISVRYTGINAGCVVSVRLIMGSGGLYYIIRTSTGK